MPPSLETLVLNLIWNGFVMQTHVEEITGRFNTELGDLQERIRTLEEPDDDA